MFSTSFAFGEMTFYDLWECAYDYNKQGRYYEPITSFEEEAPEGMVKIPGGEFMAGLDHRNRVPGMYKV